MAALLAVAGVVAGSATPVAAASISIGGGRHAGAVAIALGKSQVLTVDRPFARALVGSAEIADILPMTGNSIYVLGKKLGATNLTLYDRNRALIAVIDLNVGPDGDGFDRQIKALMPDERVGVRVANDALLLEGTVSNAVVASRVVAVAETFAPGKVINMLGVGSVQQVMLEVRFSEMRRSTAEALGIRTLALSTSGDFGAGSGDGPGGAPFRRFANRSPTDAFATIAGSFGIGGVNINIALDALEAKGLVTTLAEPTLIAMSGETGSFLAGGEFPIPVASTTGAGGVPTITIEFKEFGVSLDFTPTVLADGIVNLVLLTEVSSIDPAASIRLNDITIPGLQTRRAKTTIELRDGQSFAMAGLIRSDFSDTARQVPLLGSIPILGALFRSSDFRRGETELVIVVTPRLVRPVAPGAIRLPTDRVLPPSQRELQLEGKTERRAPEARP